MKRPSDYSYECSRNVRPYQGGLYQDSLQPLEIGNEEVSGYFLQHLFNCEMHLPVNERAQFSSRIKALVLILQRNTFDLEKISTLYARILKTFDRNKEELKELANWVREYVNNEESLFSPLVQGVFENRDIYEFLLRSIQRTIASLIPKISQYLAAESVIPSDAKQLADIIVENIVSAISLDKYLLSAQDLKEIVGHFIKNRSHVNPIDDKKIRSMAKEILNRLLLNPQQIDSFKDLYCVQELAKIERPVFEINEVLYTLLFHMDERSICNFTVSKKYHQFIETFVQNTWTNVACKKIVKIVNPGKWLEYANNKFNLDTVKKVFTNNLNITEFSWFLATLKNLEYLSLKNCRINFDPTDLLDHPLKVLDLTSCQPITQFGFTPPLNLSFLRVVCPSLVKLKLRECQYDANSFTALLSNEKFSQRKMTIIYQNGDKGKGFFEKGYLHGEGEIKFSNGCRYKGSFNEGLMQGSGLYSYPNGDFYEGNFEKGLIEGKGVWRHVSGDSYEGYVARGGQYHGSGVFRFVNGALYEGDFEEGLRHGKGRLKYQNGDLYEGDFVNGKRHGKGKMVYASGTIYQGDFENDLYHGNGELKTAVSVYKGDFKEGKQDGQGRITSGGDIYEGSVKDGSPHGKGVTKLANGNIYEGDHKDRKFLGNVLLKYPNGNIYEGEFKGWNPHGKGRLKFATGAVYEGEMRDGSPYGQGVLTTTNGNIYEFNSKDGKIFGLLKYPNGDIYEGDFKGLKSHGKGVLKFVSGTLYEGDFENGKFHGKGIMKHANGSIYEGGYEEGHAHGKGKIEYANGNIYEGNLVKGMRHGQGTITFANGDSMKGVFENNELHGRVEGKEVNGVTNVLNFDHGKKI